MPFHVRNPKTDRLVRQLARKKKIGITEAIEVAVTNELKRDNEKLPLRIRLKKITDEIAKYPDTGEKADKAFFDELSGELMFVDASRCSPYIWGNAMVIAWANALERAPVRYVSAVVFYEAVLGFAKQRKDATFRGQTFMGRSIEESGARRYPSHPKSASLRFKPSRNTARGAGTRRN